MKLLLATTALALATTSLAAQGFSGATVTLDYQTFSDVDELDSTRFSGGLEYDLGNGFAVAADLSLVNFSDFDEDITNVTVHGIYAMSPDLKVGLFLGRETQDELDLDIYGVEAAYDVSGFGIQGYLGTGDAADGGGSADLGFLGVAADYTFGGGVFVMASYDEVTIEDIGTDITFSSAEAGAGYALSSGIAAHVSVGQISTSGGGGTFEEDFMKVSLSYAFGPQGGTTFGTVGFFETLRLPGF